jgi:hypothetical protein
LKVLRARRNRQDGSAFMVLEEMMSSEKSQKSLPSAEEINAYLELSAARTKLRLPLAKGAAAVVPGPGPASGAAGSTEPDGGNRPSDSNGPTHPSAPLPAAGTARALPVQGEKTRALRTLSSGASATNATRPTAATTPADAAEDDAWRPFSSDGDG